MASLQQRLTLLAQAVGADVKALFGRVPPSGGTTGQVLTKTSATDYAAAWQTPVTFVSLTQAQYDALSTAEKNDASKVYVVS